jgi:hypothetical protein
LTFVLYTYEKAKAMPFKKAAAESPIKHMVSAILASSCNMHIQTFIFIHEQADNKTVINLPVPSFQPLATWSSDSDVFSTSADDEGDGIFPSVREVIQRVQEDKPGEGFENLEKVLSDSGIIRSPQIVLMPEHHLQRAAKICPGRTRFLRNRARAMILHLLGFTHTYDDPEIEFERQTKAAISNSTKTKVAVLLNDAK